MGIIEKFRFLQILFYMTINIKETDKKRVVIAGAGFGGLKLARELIKSDFQVILIDRNNYHQFQPLIYQVATSGLEPSSVSFPLRKIFQSKKQITIRNTKVKAVNPENNEISTSLGNLKYDYLVIATGATTNFFGLPNVKKLSYPMKSVSEALNLRNYLLQDFEKIVTETDPDKQEAFLNFVIVGGGATGVELSGALAEMRRYILPKDYPDFDFSKMKIYLIEATSKLLGAMSEETSKTSLQYLKKMGIDVLLDTIVTDYDGTYIQFSNHEPIRTSNVIWAAGISGSVPAGFDPLVIGRGNRLEVDEFNTLRGYKNIFAVGDVAVMKTGDYPKGHPQVAQVAIQQAKNLAKNLKNTETGKPLIPFRYKDLGIMATIGRNRAVAEIFGLRFKGFFAWLVWMFVHLMAIVGVKNRLLIFINWFWNYITYDQSLRLIIRPSKRVK